MNAQPNSNRRLRILRTHVAMFGFWSAVAKALILLLDRLASGRDNFDKKYGTDTKSLVPPEEANLPDEYTADAVIYIPTALATVKHVFRNLPIKYEEFELIDLGAGKGRLVLLASDYPFARIRGIELSPLLSGIATDNVKKYMQNPPRSLRCKRVEIQCANAVDFSIPDSNIVFFLYNPFKGSVFEQCMDHIHRCAAKQPTREIYLAYVNPWPCEHWLRQSGYFALIEEFQVIERHWSWSLWKHV